MITKLTLWNGQKAKKHDTIPVCTPHVIPNVTNRYIDWPIVSLASSDGDGCLITSENNRDQECPFIFGVVDNDLILYTMTS